MELHSKVKKALIDMNFVERYEELSNQFSNKRIPFEQRLIYIDGETVMDTIQALGYVPKFNSREKFFKIVEEQVDTYTFGFHIILRDGTTEFVWVVKENGTLILGSPWGIYAKRLIDSSYRIKMPAFSNYEELEEILKIAFDMYEDFKKAFVEEKR